MSLRLRDILKNFYDFDVLAGSGGLDKIVCTVTVMDAPDISNWMKGGEFLITTGYCIKDNPLELRELVINLNKAKATALGIKLGRFISTLPIVVKNIADDLNFPIIYIPTKYAFADIINPVLTNIVNKQTEILLMSEKIHKTFLEIIIEDKGTQFIIETLSKIIEKDIAFKDIYFNKLYLYCRDAEFKNDIYNRELSMLQSKYYTHILRISNNVYGYLFINNNSFNNKNNDLESIVVEHASTVLKLDIQKRISNHQVEQKFRNEFVYDLITNNITSESEVRNRALMHGWELNQGFVCLIIDIDNFKEKYISQDYKNFNIKDELECQKNIVLNTSRKLIKESFYKCYYTTFSDSIVFLIEFKDFILPNLDRLKSVSEDIRDKIKNVTNLTVTIGIGDYQDNIMNIYKSFDEAQRAIKIGRKLYSINKTIIFSELGTNKILYDLTLNDEVIELCYEYLGPLIDYDKINSTDFLNTLYVIVKNAWNLKLSSKELFMHYNTIKYRFLRICEILNLDLKDQEKRFAIELTLKLLNMNN